MTWHPIDPGEGDGDIPLPYQRAGAQTRVPGGKRTSMTVRSAKDDNKRRRKELTGGGAGGPPDVPEWFIKWEQRDDELQCNVVQHHLSELGLRVRQQSCCPATAPHATQDPAPSPDVADALSPDSYDIAPDPVPTLNLRECGDSVLSAADLKSIEGQNLLLDGIINFAFAQMSAAFAQQEEEDIVLVPTGLAFLLGNLQDPGYMAAHAAPLRLGSCRTRLVLFPVNDNENFDQADGGNHWSLLVLHIAADGSSRFVHHDSMGRDNLPHARRLADRLRPLLRGNPPIIEGPTPLQETGSNDCGLYVLAGHLHLVEGQGA
ncbi:hypothetical protein C2845_PM17G00900 [Panicum miliaceum]|uniref:Ubiquitin-like protease family profile domain-containing protein n=1 Tax=Panicum miliaceum TaxID=4540 RepID=A0A3L6Q283_PANMI|nr:hypothetical protein C2845_PM17G00900 [Panicum miliaceum]